MPGAGIRGGQEHVGRVQELCPRGQVICKSLDSAAGISPGLEVGENLHKAQDLCQDTLLFLMILNLKKKLDL